MVSNKNHIPAEGYDDEAWAVRELPVLQLGTMATSLEPHDHITGITSLVDLDTIQRVALRTLYGDETLERVETRDTHMGPLKEKLRPTFFRGGRLEAEAYVVDFDERVQQNIPKALAAVAAKGLSIVIGGQFVLRSTKSNPFTQEVTYMRTRSHYHQAERHIAPQASLTAAAHSLDGVLSVSKRVGRTTVHRK